MTSAASPQTSHVSSIITELTVFAHNLSDSAVRMTPEDYARLTEAVDDLRRVLHSTDEDQS